MQVKLNSIEDAQKFNAMALKQAFDIDVRSGCHFVDAKSIMGLFTLDLSHPIEVIIRAPFGEELEEFLDYIERIKI